MAGIFERMATIVKANVNDLIDKFEDPAKIVDQTIADAKVEYAKIKKESLSVLANENMAKKELDRLNAEADKWHGIAASALKAGNEEDARKALEKENELRASITSRKVFTAVPRPRQTSFATSCRIWKPRSKTWKARLPRSKPWLLPQRQQKPQPR